MIEIGKMNHLEVVKEVDFGFYLEGGIDFEKILLPIRYVPEGLRVGDSLDVFIYKDSEDRIIATTEKPYVMVGEFAYLEVVAVNSYGAFLDWGLSKDLILPFNQQKRRLNVGDWRTVRVYLDEYTNRIVASTKLDKFLDKTPVDYKPGQEVSLLICNRTDLGWRAIVNHLHWGLILEHEVFETLKGGTRRTGYIKNIREDGKIDLSLNPPGSMKIEDISDEIMAMLKAQGGFLPLTDKTAPEVIYGLFHMSKKTFKKALGALFRQELISIDEDGIRLVR